MRHYSLEGGWTVTETERECIKLVQAVVSDESGFLLRVIIHFDLPVPRPEVEDRKIWESSGSVILGRAWLSIRVIWFNFL